jgi:hypothetical protein
MRYVAKSTINHDGVEFNAGDEVPLTDEQAEVLLADGIVTDADAVNEAEAASDEEMAAKESPDEVETSRVVEETVNEEPAEATGDEAPLVQTEESELPTQPEAPLAQEESASSEESEGEQVPVQVNPEPTPEQIQSDLAAMENGSPDLQIS